MSTSNSIPSWIQNRILSFFNRAQNINDILDGTIQDDPSNGPGNTMGQTLAARILRERNNLPWQRFTTFQQLDDIRGVGTGTIQDLVYSFGTTADEAFKQAMYSTGTIYPVNWPLEYFRYEIADQAAFNALATNEQNLRTFIVDKVSTESQNNNVQAASIAAMTGEVTSAYIDSFSNSTPEAGYAFALWFYRFDADNWFSWERIQERTLAYFDYHQGGATWQMDFYLFKGFVNRGIVPPGISAKDLPVTVNWAEQTVSFWISALYD